jgi:hypothetical protein
MDQRISHLISEMKRIVIVPDDNSFELKSGYTGKERYIEFYDVAGGVVINDGAQFNYLADTDFIWKWAEQSEMRNIFDEFIFCDGRTDGKFGLLLDRQTRMLYLGFHKYAQLIVKYQERVDNISVLDYFKSLPPRT